jgi:hypothetical protein
MDRLSSAGDGRIYFVNSFRQLRYLDALNVAHDVLDAAGTAVFTFPTAYASADHAVHYDAATNAVYAAWNGANVCGGGLVATPEITRVPLNGAGTQVSGPTFSNSICISIAGGSSPGDAFTPTSLTPGPEGKLFLSCDNNAYVQCGRQVLIDKSTLTATTYATTTAYFGSPAADAGCYSSALGRGILLDTFSDAVRAFAQGSVGEGSIVVQGGLVSSSGGSAENTDILEIPYGVFGGLANFGTGSPGCNGPRHELPRPLRVRSFRSRSQAPRRPVRGHGDLFVRREQQCLRSGLDGRAGRHLAGDRRQHVLRAIALGLDRLHGESPVQPQHVERPRGDHPTLTIPA